MDNCCPWEWNPLRSFSVWLYLRRDPRGREENLRQPRKGYKEGVCSLILRSWTRGAGRSPRQPRQPRERSPPWRPLR
jgi:hypothetical protein